MWRHVVGLCMLLVGCVAAAGAVHNFSPNSGGHVVYGITSALVGGPALIGGAYAVLFRSGFTIDRNANVFLDWSSIAGIRRVVEYELDQCTAIELKRYWYFNRTRQPRDSIYCEVRLWTAGGDGDDIIVTRRLREPQAQRLAEALSVFLNLPIETTRGGARGVLADD